MSWKEKLKTLTSKWHPERDELSTVATTGDYDDLINKPQGGGGGGFTPYVIKISEDILDEKLDEIREIFNIYGQSFEETNFSDSDELIYSLLAEQMAVYDMNILHLNINALKFIAINDDSNKYYPYKTELELRPSEANAIVIYFYDLPLGVIDLYTIPTTGLPFSLEIVNEVYEYEYESSGSETT